MHRLTASFIKLCCILFNIQHFEGIELLRANVRRAPSSMEILYNSNREDLSNCNLTTARYFRELFSEIIIIHPDGCKRTT